MTDANPNRPLSPVEQVLAIDPGKSLLDSKPAGGRVPYLFWLLPTTFLLPGGVIAWLLVRERNRDVAMAMLIVSAILTVLTALTPLLFGNMLGAMMP